MKAHMTVIVLLLAALPLSAGVVTLDDALASACVNNTDLASAKVTLETELRDASLSSYLIPDISLSASAGLNGLSLIDQSAGSLGGNYYLGLSWDVGTNLFTDSWLMSLNRDNAHLTYTLASQSVEEAVTTSYWTLALYISQLESARAVYQDALESLEAVEQRYEAGLTDELTLNQARLEVKNYQYQVLECENTLSLAYSAFSLLTGIEWEWHRSDRQDIHSRCSVLKQS